MEINDKLAINTIRALSAEMVQKANSGHPGLPLGAAPAAYTLWRDVMKHNPKNPGWLDRDRFILSAGHGSALLYSLLHIFGYGLTIDDLKSFRQLDSLTPGHPEFGHTKGVEITTGPLGQGIANAVGMALAESKLAAEFNRGGFKPVDHFTYALCGDGCLMEGISYEAASLAGTLGLNKLIVLYDSNNITIEGSTELAFTENVGKRFEAMNWNVILVKDGNDCGAILGALNAAKNSDKPTLIEIKTQIGFGSPNRQGKAQAHGEPLGADEIVLLKQGFGLEAGKEFYVPEEVREDIRLFSDASVKVEEDWNSMFDRYRKEFPELSEKWDKWFCKSPEVPGFSCEITEKLATRAISGQLLQNAAEVFPNLIGGSADLAPSNNSAMKKCGDFSKEDRLGSNLHFGVREHAMAAIANGIAAHGGLRPYVAGFFVFSDYMKPAMRLAALMKLPVIYILTHDSIGVGEDGPTHQPVEQLAMLRSIPGMAVIRPADARETAAAWKTAMSRTNGPTALILSRQAVNPVEGSGAEAAYGAYIVKESVGETPDLLIIATGTELELACGVREALMEKNIGARVVSMPSMELFEAMDEKYKEKILPKSIRKRIVIEAASGFGWGKYAGLDGTVMSIDSFGASGPGNALFAKFGFSVVNAAAKALELFGK